MPSEDHSLLSVLDDLEHSGQQDKVSVGDLLETFQHRSLGVLLTVFGLITALPIIGGIPGVSVLAGTLILVAIGQAALGGGVLWMPKFVRRRAIRRQRFERGVKKARPWLAKIDRLVKPRLTALSAGRTNRILVSVTAAVLALSFYPLAVVPYGVTAPALGVLAMGLGLMAGDGLMTLLGYALAGITVYLLGAWL